MIPGLMPGATYRITDLTAPIIEGDVAIRKEFTVGPGEAVELGDILTANLRRRN
jgi:hypothetical protein